MEPTVNRTDNDRVSSLPVSDNTKAPPKLIVDRTVVSAKNAAIEVTELRLSTAARKALNLPAKPPRG